MIIVITLYRWNDTFNCFAAKLLSLSRANLNCSWERERERDRERARKKEKDMGSVKFGHQWGEVVVGKRGGVGCMYICLSGGLNITRIYGFMQCYF